MSEVKRWKLKGFLPGVEGECKAVFQPTVVMADDFDRVTAECDAALGREAALRGDLEKQIARTNDFASKLTGAQAVSGELQQRLTAGNGRADVSEGLLREYPGQTITIYEKAWLAKVRAALKPAEGGGDGM